MEQNRFRSWALWVSVAGAVWVIAEACRSKSDHLFKLKLKFVASGAVKGKIERES